MIHLKKLKKLYPGIEINHKGRRQMEGRGGKEGFMVSRGSQHRNIINIKAYLYWQTDHHGRELYLLYAAKKCDIYTPSLIIINIILSSYLFIKYYILFYTSSLEGLSDTKTLVPEVKKDEMTEEEKKQGFRIRNLREINEETTPDEIVSREYKGTPLDRNQKQEL